MRPRLIPVLLLDRHQRLVKTVCFGERTYIGDPFNVVRLFNEKEVDELCVLDIDATPDGREPNFEFLRQLASECFMPLAYGGGITKLQHCDRLNNLGIEKFILGAACEDEALVRAMAADFGSQSVCACVDAVRQGSAYVCATRSGQRKLRQSPVELAVQLEQAGVGEVILQSVDQDGKRQGYDLPLIREVSQRLTIPLIALGGACGESDLVAAIQAGASAAASGSAFCFIGRLRAVLVSYPSNLTWPDTAEHEVTRG